MDNAQIEHELEDLEGRLERLRALYEQYFLGLEKLEPTVLRKDVDRKLWVLRREQIRNTGLRFKFQMLIQRYNTYQQYWTRVVREIENGTYRRDVLKVAQRFGEKEALTILGKKRAAQYKRLAQNQAARRGKRKGGEEKDEGPEISAVEEEIALGPDDLELVEEDEAEAIEPEPDDDDTSVTPPRGMPAVQSKAPEHAAKPPPDMEALLQMATVGVTTWGEPKVPHARPPAAETKSAAPEEVEEFGHLPIPAPPVAVPRIAPAPSAAPSTLAEPPPTAAMSAPPAPSNASASAQPAQRGASRGPTTTASSAQPGATAKSRVAELAAQMRAKKEAAKPKAESLDLDNLLDTAPSTALAPPPAQPAAPPKAAPPTATAAPPTKPSPAAPATTFKPTPAASATASPLPRPPAAPAAPASPSDLSEQRIREIYAKYVGAKRAANESTAGLTFDKLASSLRAQAEKIRSAHPSRSVDFEIVTKDGKTALRPVVK
jgi:hypothetical protein